MNINKIIFLLLIPATLSVLLLIYLYRIELLLIFSGEKLSARSCTCCCPGTVSESCLYFFKGDRFAKVANSNNRSGINCSLFGCSPEIEYRYCDLDFFGDNK